MAKKILFVSDLDGTLITSAQTTSTYTIDVINKLTDAGYLFSYATARSLLTARKVTEGLEAKIPVIVYNGTFIMDNQTSEVLDASYMRGPVRELLGELFEHDIFPLVYAMVEGKERFTLFPEKCSKATLDFVAERNDCRKRVVHSIEELVEGDIFYITCIDEPDKLKPFFEKYKEIYHCIYQKDIYSGEQWLEFLPKEATKASAIERLKAKLGCDYVIAFGDGLNDIEMFEHADEAYAVENADAKLKAIATGVIAGNNEDGVAHWLENKLTQLGDINGKRD